MLVAQLPFDVMEVKLAAPQIRPDTVAKKDVIDRLCIEAALEITGDNRASAAEILGLSRQSLYVKLRRYGLGDLGSDEAGEPEAFWISALLARRALERVLDRFVERDYVTMVHAERLGAMVLGESCRALQGLGA